MTGKEQSYVPAIISEDEGIMMVRIFKYMKQKRWLKPYNAPKFRMAYANLYPDKYKKIVKNMGKKKKKDYMFHLYRKYYLYFIENKQFEYWLQKENEKEME